MQIGGTMTRDELKALGLTDEQVAKVAEGYEKNYVEKSRYAAKEDEVKTTRGELDKLKKDHKDNAELVKQIDELRAAADARDKEHAAKVKAMEIDSIVEKSLLSAKAKNTAAVRALLQLDGAEAENGAIKGLDDQIKKLKESDAYLFEEDTVRIDGLNPPGGNGSSTPAQTVQQQFAAALEG
nr:MAG TPA: minor structural protein [Caudoviricetes sp.]